MDARSDASDGDVYRDDEQRLRDPLLKEEGDFSSSPVRNPPEPAGRNPAGPPPSVPNAPRVHWASGSELVQSNIIIPELPDETAELLRLTPWMFGWLAISVVNVGLSFMFGPFLLFGIFSLAGGILGIVGSSLHICKCCTTNMSKLKGMRSLGVSSITLNIFALVFALVVNLLICHDRYCAMPGFIYGVSAFICVVAVAQSAIAFAIIPRLQKIQNTMNPVSSGLVAV